jgi:hypothetical protein
MDRNHLDNLGRDGKIIPKWILKKQEGGMNWVDLGHAWQALMNMILNLQVLQNCGSLLMS